MNDNYFTPLLTRPSIYQTIVDSEHNGFYFSRGIKRATPEVPPTYTFGRIPIPPTPSSLLPTEDTASKRARTVTINSVRDCILIASTSEVISLTPPIPKLKKVKPLLSGSQIVERFGSLLNDESILRQIYSGTITTSSTVENTEYTFFEIAIFSNEWDLAKKILLNDSSSEISIQSEINPTTELFLLMRAAQQQQWDFIKNLLSRNIMFIEADCLSLCEGSPILRRVGLVVADHFSSSTNPSYSEKTRFCLKHFVELAVNAEETLILIKLIEKYGNFDSKVWIDPLFFLIHKKTWSLVQMLLIYHPDLTTVSLGSNPYSLYQKSVMKNETILWLLCFHNQASIIRAILPSVDYTLFFKTHTSLTLHCETTPFALLSVHKQRNLVAFLLDSNNEDRSYDVMRWQRFPFETSILAYAIETQRWFLTHFILEYYFKVNQELKGVYNVLKDLDYQTKISSTCPDSALKEKILKLCNYFLSKFIPVDSLSAESVESSSSIDCSDKRVLDEWDQELREMIER